MKDNESSLVAGIRRNWQIIVTLVGIISMFVAQSGDISMLKVQAADHANKDEVTSTILMEIKERLVKIETNSTNEQKDIEEIKTLLTNISR